VEQPSTNPATPPLPLREVGILLVKHHGLHEGLWDVALHIGVSIGQLGVSPDKSYPGAMFTVSGVALSRVDKIGPLTVNAAEVIPAAWAGIPDEYSTAAPTPARVPPTSSRPLQHSFTDNAHEPHHRFD
jgi:hypothetical protein